MIERVSFADAATVVISGATFVPLALGLRFGLSRLGLSARGSQGELRRGATLGIVLLYCALIFAHAMALWALGVYHPALNVFYAVSGALLARPSQRKPAAGAPSDLR